MCAACCAIPYIIALGPLAGTLGAERGSNVDGDTQKELDIRANELMIGELKSAPVAYIVSEELDGPLAINSGASLYVAIDPLDGSSNIDANISIGTFFSIHTRVSDSGPGNLADCLQTGSRQVAAGYVMYGSSTVLVYSTGDGVHGFTLDP